MRGEELPINELCGGHVELPPHARRRVHHGFVLRVLRGITSACAEKSPAGMKPKPPMWNYLRMRGEELSPASSAPICLELPPHARRRELVPHFYAGTFGITSACAEKSVPGGSFHHNSGNYLRMRGEESGSRLSLGRAGELPPHARRRACRLPRHA